MTISQVNDEIARLNKKVSTLKGLPDVENQTEPLTDAVTNYYQNNIALGGGPNGTWLISDFFGPVSGVPFNQSLTTINELLQQGQSLGYFSTLNEVYVRITNALTDVYGVPPGIVIPPGPGAGTYSTYDDAALALVAAAETAIGTLNSTYPDFVNELNTAWNLMEEACPQSIDDKFDLAGVAWADLQYAQLPISAFIPTIGDLGKNTQQGMSAQVLEGLANTSNIYGQALVGAMREGRNEAGIEDIGVSLDNAVPSTPASVPPQAPLSSGNYTVAEARAKVSAGQVVFSVGP